jgi:hypothetical protein
MNTSISTRPTLALLGGTPAIADDDPSLFHWPIVTAEDEQAVIEVLRAGKTSGIDVTQQFEAEWAEYVGANAGSLQRHDRTARGHVRRRRAARR